MLVSNSTGSQGAHPQTNDRAETAWTSLFEKQVDALYDTHVTKQEAIADPKKLKAEVASLKQIMVELKSKDTSREQELDIKLIKLLQLSNVIGNIKAAKHVSFASSPSEKTATKTSHTKPLSENRWLQTYHDIFTRLIERGNLNRLPLASLETDLSHLYTAKGKLEHLATFIEGKEFLRKELNGLYLLAFQVSQRIETLKQG